jgi:hypothetical protein
MTGRDSYELSAAEVLASCRASYAPVNANAAAAIEAHKMAVQQRCPDLVQWLALTAVIRAAVRMVKDDQVKLEYLASVPEQGWPPSPAPFCDRREATLDMLRRSIGWQAAG